LLSLAALGRVEIAGSLRQAEALKKTGKVMFVGFSTLDVMIAVQIHNAAVGGFIDVIMLKYTPWLDNQSGGGAAVLAQRGPPMGLSVRLQMEKFIDTCPMVLFELAIHGSR
jgi:hypothetical protein